MYEAKCDDCGKNATLPFKPKEGRPVYCSTCFSSRVSDKRRRSKLNLSVDLKNAWARRECGFRGRREEKPASIFKKY